MAVSIADLAIRVDASQLRQAQTDSQRLIQSGRDLDNTANRLSSSWSNFGNILASVGLGLGVRQIIQYMDTWNNLEGRLKLVTKSTQELITVQDQLFEIANNSRSNLESSIELYQKLAQSQDQLNLSSNQLVKITDTINKSMIISGSGAQQASAAILQLGQAFASGVLAGDEFRSVAENSPRLIQAIAAGWKNADGSIGVSLGKLRQLSRDQKLDTESLTSAIIRSSSLIDKEFSKMPTTIGQAFTVANNELLHFIGVGGQTSGVARAISDAIMVLSKNIENIAGSVLVAVGAWATYKAVLLGISFAGFLSGIGSAIASMSVYDEALATNAVFNADNAVSIAERSLVLAESTVATEAAAVASYQLVVSENQLALSTINLARAEAARSINISAATALIELQAIVQDNLAISQTGLAESQAALTAAQRAQSIATSELNIALAAQTTANSALAASTTLTARAAAFFSSILPAIKAELAAIGVIISANPFAALATAIVAAGTALYLYRDAQVSAFNYSGVEKFNDATKLLSKSYNEGKISLDQFNESLAASTGLLKENKRYAIELGDYFVGIWNAISVGAKATGDLIKLTFKGVFDWIEKNKPNWKLIFDITLPKWLTTLVDALQKQAEIAAKARIANEELAKSQDNIARGLGSINEQGLNFNKNQEDLYAKLIDQADKLTLSEHDRLMKEINDSKAVGKEREALLALLKKIDEAKNSGLKNGELEKSQIKDIQDLAKSSIDAQIADIKRLTDAKLQSYGLEDDILKNQYSDNLITAKQYHDAKIALINKERDANISALIKTQGKYQELSIKMMDINSAYQAILKIESSGGNKAQVNTTSHALGQMQVLPSTLRDPGYGVNPFQPAIDQNISNLTEYNTLLKFVKENEEGLKKFGEEYFKGLVNHYGSVEKAVQSYGDGTISYMEKFKAYYTQISGQNKESIELINKARDADAGRFSANINAQKEIIAINHELKKAIEEYDNAAQSANVHYLEMTGKTAQAAIEADNLAKSTDNIRKQAVLLGDSEALKFIDAIRVINPDIKPLQDKIEKYGLLEFQVTNALKAEYEEAGINPANQGQLEFINAKIEGYKKLSELQQMDSRKSIGDQLKDQLTDDNTKRYVDNLKLLREAQIAGVDQNIITDYAKKIQIEFDSNSPAALKAHEFFNILKETSSQGFEAMLKNGKSASEAMKDMFINMADNITASFLKLGQNSLFDWFETGTMAAGGWRNIAIAGLSIGAQLLANVLGADQPTRTPSTSESYRSNELGASQMALIDSISRNQGFNFSTKAAAIFNQSIENLSNFIQNNILKIADGIQWVGQQIASTEAFNTISNWLGGLGEGIGKITSLLSQGFKIINDLYNGAVNSIASYLGLTKAAESALEGTTTAIGDKLAGVVGKALAVVGAIYSIYTFATSIGDIIDTGTIGQIVGAVLGLSSALMSVALIFLGGGPIGWIVAGVLALVGLFLSIFDTPRSPLIMLTSIGNDLRKFKGVWETQFPSGRGAITVSSAFGTTELRSQYEGGLNAEQLKNAAGPLLEIIAATDNAIAAALDKIDTQKQTTNYIRSKLNQYIQQNLDSADVSKMIDARYNEIANLAGESGTATGIALNKIFDILMDKFKAFDKNSLAAMGIMASIATNLQNFIDTVPLSFWDLINKRIEGVGSNKTADEFTKDLNNAILGFVALKNVLQTIGTISDDAIVAIMDVNGSVIDIGLNMAQFVISLKTISPAITIDQVTAEIVKIKAATANLTNEQQSAFFSTFGIFSEMFKGMPVSIPQLTYMSNQMRSLAESTIRAANNTINYAIAENNLAGVSRESAIQILLRTKAIDEQTVTESNLTLAIKNVTKTQLDAMGFIQTFVVATGKTLLDFGTSASAWFEAGKNVVAIFGDMKAAADFYTKISGAFLSDDEQKLAANEIAKNNVKNLIDAANLAGLGDKLGIESLTSESATAWITNLLKSGMGINEMIAVFSDANQGSLFKNLFEALANLKQTTDALAESTDKLTEAQRAQISATLEEWLQKNKIGGLSNLNDFSKNAEFVQQINSTYASALQGNSKAAGSITGLIDEYLQFSQKFNPANYEDIVNWARSLIANLENKLVDGTHANGLSNVPFDGYIAKLHQGERVLTKTESSNYDNDNYDNDNYDNDNSETVRLLIELIKTEREGFKRVITELQTSNKNSNDLKASARRKEVAS